MSKQRYVELGRLGINEQDEQQQQSMGSMDSVALMVGQDDDVIPSGRTRPPTSALWRSRRLKWAAVSTLLLVLLISLLAWSPTSSSQNRHESGDQNTNTSTPTKPPEIDNRPRMTLSDALYGRYSGHLPSLTFLPSTSDSELFKDGSVLAQDANGNMVVRHVNKDNDDIVLVPAHVLRGTPGFDTGEAQVSKDGRFVLLRILGAQRWRHSRFAQYYVYDRTRNAIEKVGLDDVIYAELSPSNSVALVSGGNLYIYAALTLELTQLTHDGGLQVSNGASDWVYEEEVLASPKALWHSPAGTQLAYIKFNDTLVDTYEMAIYGSHQQNPPRQYTTWEEIKYPKPGRPNPRAQLFISDLNTTTPTAARHTEVDLSRFVANTGEFPIIYNVQWINASHLAVRFTDRFQSEEYWVALDTTSTTTNMDMHMLRYHKKENGWFENGPDLVLINETHYIHLVEKNNYPHLALFEFQSIPLSPASSETSLRNDGSIVRMLTSGEWEVTELIGWNKHTEQVWYLSTEVDSTQRHLYSIDLFGQQKKRYGSAVGYHRVTASPALDWMVLDYLGPSVPTQTLLGGRSGDEVKVMQDNAALKKSVEAVNLPRKELLRLDVPGEDGLWVNAEIIYPVGFHPVNGTASARKYPLLVTGYWGPNSQKVSAQWAFDHKSYLASATENKEMAVLTLDVRGSAARGLQFREIITRNLGKYEISDIISVTDAFVKNHSTWIDPTRVGIWGWSYGGYATAKVIEQDTANVFSTGISVAPVTHWMFYDSIYTERYMKSTASNAAGYQQSSVHTPTSTFNQHSYLVIHGTADDNVHYQQTLYLLAEFQRADVDPMRVRDHTVPDDNHGMGRTQGAYPYVMEYVTDFIHGKLVGS